MAKPTLCNWCKKPLYRKDISGGVSLHKEMGYGSQFDGQLLDLDLCPECSDKFVKMIENQCKISMLVDDGSTELL